MVSEKKRLGQYMTPERIVTMILDAVGYEGSDILNKKIIEPSFGDGGFICEIVNRIIKAGKDAGIDVKPVIENNVYGFEIDESLYDKAIERVKTLCAENGIYDLELKNLIHGDTVFEYRALSGKMDYCVGNPPYVRDRNIPEKYRNVINSFEICRGNSDLYILFYGIGIELLNKTGKLAYITPNTFFKCKSQQNFRNYLIYHKLPSLIYDFKTSKIFDDALTSACIFVIDKNEIRNDISFEYKYYNKNELVYEKRFKYEYLKEHLFNNVWVFLEGDDLDFLNKNRKHPVKITSFGSMQIAFSTNNNSIFVHKIFYENEPYFDKHTENNKIVYFYDNDKKIEIESGILKKCVNSATFNGIIDNTYIICPYKINKSVQLTLFNEKIVEKKYEQMTENELKRLYPFAYAYLYSHRNELLLRDKGLGDYDWFAYSRMIGRNQFYKKIVFKNILDKIHPVVVPYIVDEDVIVYSYCLTIANKNDENYLQKLYKIYSSKEFARYCALIGKDKWDGRLEVTPIAVNNFGISPELLREISCEKEDNKELTMA